MLAGGQADDGRYCFEALVETTVESLPTDWRVRSFCREDDRWQEVVEGLRRIARCFSVS